MDEDGLPLVGSGIDLTKVPAIQQKRTVAFLNQFVVHTVQFLNRFSTVCEEKLSVLSLRIQHIETTLNILDAKLSSIPGLEDVKFEVSSATVNSVANGPIPQGSTEQQSVSVSPQSEQNSIHEIGQQKTEVAAENVMTVAKDPRYARYLKMVQVVHIGLYENRTNHSIHLFFPAVESVASKELKSQTSCRPCFCSRNFCFN
ncbi:WASH complex subunit 3 isoform X2 [Carettochelys insculpta]|uniref:WASH complex subunit 3 isoform X2 n=1 Tax=Carettochelys insculpta TaxID=44489 RepID=UPI003EBA356B